MPSTHLRSMIIRLAHTRPELRTLLLPILKVGALPEVIVDSRGKYWVNDALVARIEANPDLNKVFRRENRGVMLYMGDFFPDNTGGGEHDIYFWRTTEPEWLEVGTSRRGDAMGKLLELLRVRPRPAPSPVDGQQ